MGMHDAWVMCARVTAECGGVIRGVGGRWVLAICMWTHTMPPSSATVLFFIHGGHSQVPNTFSHSCHATLATPHRCRRGQLGFACAFLQSVQEGGSLLWV